ncbi:phage tail protein [Aliivibrio fischeri]|uniref:phage tail-collar fiber domain-containing protein n=1 Tax=Aliivibrio fischeri TaxID=668 RepID=UPI001F28B1C0|nr:phage tail protein [Aliivibrio fischeri]
MSQTAIPLEFEKYLQNKISLNQPTALNEVIFAMIPDLDLSKPIDRSVTLPPLEYWVHQQYVDQIGKSGSNAVVYSVVIPGSKEPFTFNAMFLRDDNVPNSCGMVVYKATETKETGMALTKSMLMQFDGAASAANITVDAATWQIDYQARLNGIDEEHRLSCLDNYGHTAFVEGFGVAHHETEQSKYIVESGVAYIGGLRIQSTLSTVQTIINKPTTLWLDVFRDGTALSTHENLFQVVVSNDDLVDYTDEDGRIHYVAKLASIEADGEILDLRVKGGLDLAEMKSNAATDKDIDSESQEKKHVKLPQLWRAIRKYVLDKLWLPLAELIYPVGSPIPYPGTEAPSDKYIAFIGQAFDMVAFPMLAERYPSGIMPDLRKGYIRGLGEGEEALSFKAQSVQPLGFEGEDMDPHQHSVTMRGGNVASGGSSGFYMSYQQQWSQTQKTQAVSAGKAKGIITGTGDETNPNSYRFLFITRAA